MHVRAKKGTFARVESSSSVCVRFLVDTEEEDDEAAKKERETV